MNDFKGLEETMVGEVENQKRHADAGQSYLKKYVLVA
jgi:hypothetical protein